MNLVQNFAGMSINDRPSFTKTCALCSGIKVVYPGQLIGSIDDLPKTFTCNDCKARPVRMLSDGAIVTVKDNESSKVVGRPRSTEPREIKVRQTTIKGSRRIPAMFADGDIKAGDVVGVLASPGKLESLRDGIQATVVDAKNVNYNGEVMSFNAFGQAIVKHSALNVYIWLTINGKLLNDIR